MHIEATERTIASNPVFALPEHAALVELLRWFAREMDDKPTARAAQGYLSALKDIQRVLAMKQAVPTSDKRAKLTALRSANGRNVA